MAFNHHEEYWDMPYWGNDRTNHIPYAQSRIIVGIVRFLVRIVFRLRIEGQEIVDKFKGKANGAILVSPHYSYLDVVIMLLAVRPRGWVRLIGRDSLFTVAGGILGNIFSHAGAFPIKRNSADRTALKRAARMLKNGEWVGIFPEGTRRGKGSAEPKLNAGVSLIARMGKAPIIPLGLENVSKVKQKGQRLRLPKITARFGNPVMLSAFDFLPKDDRLEACAWYVMRESYALTLNCPVEEVDMVALFPDTKDYSQVFAENPIEPFDPATLPDYTPKPAKESSAKDSSAKGELAKDSSAKDGE